MVKLGTLLDALGLLTGRRARHNRALRYVSEWAETIREFLTVYDLYGNSSFKLLLENIGKSKFDLTFMAYKGRLLIRMAMDIRGQAVSPLILEVVTSAENIRRILINPSLQGEKLSEVVLSFRKSYEKLQDTLSGMK